MGAVTFPRARRLLLAGVALSLLLFVSVLLAGSMRAQEPGADAWAGELPDSGVALVSFNGGTVEQLSTSAESLGIRSIWRFHDGTVTSLIVGAPAFVNAEFANLFDGGIAPGTSFVVRVERPAAERTEIITYEPSPADAVGVRHGDCFSPALTVTGRDDAWRCMIGNQIEDPCFETDGERLVCGVDPIAGEPGFALEPIGPLPEPAPATDGPQQYWLLELEDGQACGFATGATAVFEGERLNYWCSGGGGILGHPGNGDRLTARVVSDPALLISGDINPGRDIETLAITRAWR